jgi:hypothetical protein
MTEKATTGVGTTVNVSEYQTVVFMVATDGGGDYNGTFKFVGSGMQTAPTFSSAASKTNHWIYADVIDLSDGASIDGATGVAVAGADAYKMYELNATGMTWVNVNQTARAAGELTVWIRGYKNS